MERKIISLSPSFIGELEDDLKKAFSGYILDYVFTGNEPDFSELHFTTGNELDLASQLWSLIRDLIDEDMDYRKRAIALQAERSKKN